MPRIAAPDPNGPVLRFPRLNLESWYRVAGIANDRGLITGRMLDFLGFAQGQSNSRGLITDVPRLIATWASFAGVSKRTAWSDFTGPKGAVVAGWVRCTQHSAPGVPARYELQLPVALVPGDLPVDLAAALGLYEDIPEPHHADSRYGHLSAVPPAPTGPERQDDHQEPEQQDADQGEPCVLHTSPITRGPVSPLSLSTSPQGAKTQQREEVARSRGRGPVSGWEVERARQVLARCEPLWCAQRGPGGGLTARQVDAVVFGAVLALRRTTPGAVVELVTVQVRSARDLAAVVAARLWRLVRTWRTHEEQAAWWDRHGPAVDEDRTRSAPCAEAAARVSPEQAAARESAREAVTAARESARRRAEAVRQDEERRRARYFPGRSA